MFQNDRVTHIEKQAGSVWYSQMVQMRRVLCAHRFAEAHLVSEDAIEAVLVQGDNPLDALYLVRPQLPFNEGHELLLHLHKNDKL
jgi:hypothetical protein